MLRAIRPAIVGCALLAALVLLVQPQQAGAQGVPPASSPVTPEASPEDTNFRCPGVTEVSASADASALTTPTSSSSALALSPAGAAASPCILAGSGPEIEWSAYHVALRMTAAGTWAFKMRSVLDDFDTLHRQYVANPRVKDIGMWPSRLEETLQLANLLSYHSRQDIVVYYASALRDEYKAGIFDERPLLVAYGLNARTRLDELTSPPPARTPHPRARR
ncbi:MAG: hypothetical protein ACR2NO_03405 [Chloroflexota bacterium]